jgi:heme-degrading monooxygenase HmoA
MDISDGAAPVKRSVGRLRNSPDMLVRHFTATVSPANAPRYYAFFRDTLTPQLKQIPGHRGALVMSHGSGDTTNILVLTFWDSAEAIARFAGDTPDLAVVEPQAQALLSSFDETIVTYTVELDTRI